MLGIVGGIPNRIGGYIIPKHHDDGYKWLNTATLPENFQRCKALVYNNEIHIIGSQGTSAFHYKWDGYQWTKASDMPDRFDDGIVQIYNNEIHIMGGNSVNPGYHYKWNGIAWSYVSKFPYSFLHGSSVVYNNEIHVLGGRNGLTSHHKWNGTEWVSVSTLPYNFYGGGACVYNNEIHIFGCNSLAQEAYQKSHYKWNGTTWVSVSTLPIASMQPYSFIYNDEMYMGGGNTSSSDVYKWTGTEWVKSFTTPYIAYKSGVTIYNNDIHIIGGGSTSADYTKHFSYTNNVTTTLRIPAQSKILSSNCTLVREYDDLVSQGYLIKSDVGYDVLKDIPEAIIIRNINNFCPITILRGKEILYAEAVTRQVDSKDVIVCNLPRAARINQVFVPQTGEFTVEYKDNVLIEL